MRLGGDVRLVPAKCGACVGELGWAGHDQRRRGRRAGVCEAEPLTEPDMGGRAGSQVVLVLAVAQPDSPVDRDEQDPGWSVVVFGQRPPAGIVTCSGATGAPPGRWPGRARASWRDWSPRSSSAGTWETPQLSAEGCSVLLGLTALIDAEVGLLWDLGPVRPRQAYT
jgi:hypothetical protein